MVDPTVILAGAIPAAVLALALDGILMLVERSVRSALAAGRRRRWWGAGAGAALVLAGAAAVLAGRTDSANVVTVGSKNFTEQILLGELLAQALERQGLQVARRLNLGGTFICDRAIRSGDIDLYVEYSGTALTAIFHDAVIKDRRQVFDRVRQRYADAGLTLFDPLGFENTFAILVRGSDARTLGLTTLESAAPHTRGWQAGFGYEFLQRADGYPGLARTYGLTFARPARAMDLSLIYRALAEREVDLIAGDATSGLIEAYDLYMLEDNRQYFPPYDAAVVARTAAVLARPDIKEAVATLTGRITIADMRRMNHAVDAGRRDPAQVAAGFLASLR
jgi:osmoprotectant transport system permease protein